MPGELSILIVGDFNANNETHRATDEGISHAARQLGLTAEARWVPTTHVEQDTAGALSGAAAYLIAPGSPYKSMQGALEAIRVARESGVPLLGTCGGFQHIVIEYARNVLGFIDAQHAEYDPYASNLFVTALSCSLFGQTMSIEVKPGSRAADFYRAITVEERYYCNFGLNPAHQQLLDEHGLKVAALDNDGEARIMEIPEHPFFVGTLFVPQARSTATSPHPLLLAYLRAAAAHQGSRVAVESRP